MTKSAQTGSVGVTMDIRDRVIAIIAEQAVLDVGCDPDSTLEGSGHRQPRSGRVDLCHRGGFRHLGARSTPTTPRPRAISTSRRSRHRRGGRGAGRGTGGAAEGQHEACRHHRGGHDQRAWRMMCRARWRPCARGAAGSPAGHPRRRPAVDPDRRAGARLGPRGAFQPPADRALRPFTQFTLLAAREAVAQSGLNFGRSGQSRGRGAGHGRAAA
jgi:hypothetical protein